MCLLTTVAKCSCRGKKKPRLCTQFLKRHEGFWLWTPEEKLLEEATSYLVVAGSFVFVFFIISMEKSKYLFFLDAYGTEVEGTQQTFAAPGLVD